MASDSARSDKRAAGYSSVRMRSATLHFLAGRLGSALASFATAILVARWLSTPEYASYTLLLSVVVFLDALSSLGIREVVHRFLPEVAVLEPGARLRAVALSVFAVRLAALGLAMAGLYMAAPWLAESFHMPEQTWGFRAAAYLLGAMVVLQGCCLLLETVLMQAVVKWLWVAVAVARLAGMVLAYYTHQGLTLDLVLGVEVLANALVAVPALWAVWRIDRCGLARALPASVVRPGDPGLWRRLGGFAVYNYLMVLTLVLQGSAVNRMVVGAYVPVAALAVYGFAQMLSDNVQRYLPNTLLLNIVRPAIMGRWSEGHDHGELHSAVNLFFKINLWILLPLLAWLATCGSGVASWLSGGRYPEAGPLLFGLCCLLVLQCHNRRFELVLQAVENTRLLFLGNLFVVAGVGVAVLLVRVWGGWGIVAAMGTSMLAREVFLYRASRYATGLGHADLALTVPGWERLILAAVAGGLAAIAVPLDPGTLPGLLVSGAACLGVYVAGTWLMRFFSPWERRILNQLLGRRLFKD